jgi:hypothetical protein
MVLGAVSGIETSSLRSSLGKSKQPGVTEPTLALGRGQVLMAGAARTAEPLPTRQASARFRPRTMTDSPALHPLHSISLQFRRLHFRFTSFRRPQTVETV